MKIIIATGVYPPDVGGPAKYASNLFAEFTRMGHQVKVLSYRFEKRLPIGLRHFWYFLKVVLNINKVDLIIALDMFSTGYPAILAGKLFHKKTILRVGGDFLWETYTEKTGHLIKLPDFYANNTEVPLKHKIIRYLQKYTLENAGALAYNTHWQKGLFEKFYSLGNKKTSVIENYYGARSASCQPKNKNFLFAGRRIKFKNLALVESVFNELKNENSEATLEIVDNLSREDLNKKICDSYALLTLSISDFSPNFIIEGLVYGKPFILTKDCGLKERVGNLGIIIDATNKAEIKRAIKSLLDQNIYDDYIQKIKDFTFIHSWTDIANEFLSVYKNL